MENLSAPVRVARPGTQMVRLSDVRGVLSKLIAFAKNNVEQAEAEGRFDDAEVQQVRRRAFNLALDGLMDDCPVFLNPAAATERTKEDA